MSTLRRRPNSSTTLVFYDEEMNVIGERTDPRGLFEIETAVEELDIRRETVNPEAVHLLVIEKHAPLMENWFNLDHHRAYRDHKDQLDGSNVVIIQ